MAEDQAAAVTSTPGDDWLRTIIAESGGWIPVERFMAEAAFHPQHGYYTDRVRTVGRTGDFSTSATLHPALGQALATWAYARRREVLEPGWRGGDWHVIELGAGNGQLAESFLRALNPWRRRGLHLHLVEVSPRLRAEQQARLRPWADRVCWHGEIASALAAADAGRALVFSNEFVDAFPCRQWEWRAGTWREIGVVWSAGPSESFAEESRVLPGLPVAECTALDPTQLPAPREGQRVEAHLAYRDWLRREMAPGWRAGRLLTIDYGAELPALYHRRPRGTLRAYFHHLRLEGADFYARPGRQDLTADVNFSDPRRWGRALGWGEGDPALQTQGEFLRRWLPRRLTAQPDPALAFLLDEAGAGGAFRVLEQRPAAGD